MHIFEYIYFISDGNFKVATGKSMDYETIPFYNCSFFIDDGIEESGPFILELTALNDNETPEFSDTMYFATATEGSVRTTCIYILRLFKKYV